MATEKTAERGFNSWAKGEGWKVKKTVSPGRKGTFDRVYIKMGVHAWIEWKHPDGTGELSHHQEVEFQELLDHGAHAAVFDDQLAARRWLKNLDPS